MSGKVRVKAIIYGLVQGVFFRYTTKLKAQEYGLTGWVRNLPGGEVETLFEGDEDKVGEMVKWCHKGPSGARVEKVDLIYQKYTGEFDSFYIKH